MRIIRILLGLPILPLFLFAQVIWLGATAVISPFILLMWLIDLTRGEGWGTKELLKKWLVFPTSLWWEIVK